MRPRYTNDRKAPRMRKASFSHHLISKELWKEFRQAYPEYAEKTDKELTALWDDIAKTIRHETVENPLGVKLASYTGELKLQYLPYKFESDDHKASEELGQTVNNKNIMHRGKTGKIKWERRWAVKFNSVLQFYAFEAIRELKTLGRDHIRSNPERIRVSRNTLGGKSVWRPKK